MGLVTKEELRQLKPDYIETVWPGDSAVDLDASDLMAWCKEGGSSGLVMKAGEEPTVFKLRALPDRAYRHVMSMFTQSPSLVADEAFKFGLVSVSDKSVPVIPTTTAGMRAASETTMDLLGGLSMDLHDGLLDHQWTSATNDEEEETDDEVALDTQRVSLPRALGVQVLAATFRTRKRDE